MKYDAYYFVELSFFVTALMFGMWQKSVSAGSFIFCSMNAALSTVLFLRIRHDNRHL